MESKKWSENDELFFSELKKGKKWEEYVAKKLQKEGFDARCGELTIRDSIKDVKSYADQFDVVVHLPHRKFRIEVKSRSLRFTGRRDFPFPDTIVETVGSYSGRSYTVDMYCMVSQHTGGMFVLSHKTKEFWTVKNVFDTVRKITDPTYHCSVRKAMSWELFVKRLKNDG